MKRFLHEFNHYRDGTVSDNGWWEIRGDRLLNLAGGFHYYIPREDDIIVEANSFQDLDWNYLIKPESPYGWLAPDGRFYGCAPYEHEDIASLVLKTDERSLEKSNWIKLYRDYPSGVGFYCAGRITEPQARFLINREVIKEEPFE